eukprot:351213_1
MTLFVSIILLLSTVCINGLIKEFLLTPNTPNSNNGINISYQNISVNVDSTEWKVTYATQQSYDILLQLNSEWGFDDINPSNISIILNGTNYNSAEGDLLIVFSSANNQYFSVVIRNEDSNNNYKVYPSPYLELEEND